MYYFKKRQTKTARKLLSLTILCGLGISLLSPSAEARLIFTTEEDGVDADTYTLDQDGTVAVNENADLDLNFGFNLGASISYNDFTDQFTFNKDVNLGGNNLKDFKVESFTTAGAPTCTLAGEAGRMYYDTTANEMMVCTGVAGWNSVEDLGAGSITTTEILDGTITAADLGTDSVDSDEIAADAVTASEIATGAVTTTEILDGTIATVDIANNAIDGSKIGIGTTAGDTMYYNGTDWIRLGIGTAGQQLVTNAGATAPEWVTSAALDDTLTDTNIFVGNGSNVATGVAMSGDATIANTGALTIANNAITSAKIAVDTIVAADIATGAVTTAEILDGTIATGDIAAGAITGGTGGVIADGTITSADLGTDSVDSNEIAANAVTASEIATGAVTTTEILDGTIATGDIANDAITSAKIGTAGAGDANKVLTTDGSGDPQWELRSNFGTSTLASGDIFIGNVGGTATGVTMSGDGTLDNTGNFQLAANSVTASEIATGAVTTTEILDGTIAAADLGTGSVTSSAILDGTISTGDIAAGAITGGSGGIIADGTITSADLGTDSVDSDEIAANAVTASEIATGAVTTTEILDGTIVAADIATGAVTTAEILDGTVTRADLASVAASLIVAPEFANFTLEADGSNNKGTFESDHDSAVNKNFYKWSTRKTAALHDYDLVYQWQVPENFISFQATPLEIDFKTDLTTAIDNTLTISSILDTAGTTVGAITGGSNLTSAVADTWVEDSAVTFSTAGTFTPGEYMTIRFKFASEATTKADRNPVYLGPVKFNINVK